MTESIQFGPSADSNNGIHEGDAFALAEYIADSSVDLVCTDPPFGIDFNYKGAFQDESDDEKYAEFIQKIIWIIERVLRPGGYAFVWQAQPKIKQTWPLFPKSSRLFVAAKNFVQIRPAVYIHHAYDPVIFWKKDGKLKLPGGRDWHIGSTSRSWNNKNSESYIKWHPCPRPLDTVQYIVEHFSPPGGLVLDLFSGSGTSAVACRNTERRWLAFEINPEYVQKSRLRLKGCIIKGQDIQLSMAV